MSATEQPQAPAVAPDPTALEALEAIAQTLIDRHAKTGEPIVAWSLKQTAAQAVAFLQHELAELAKLRAARDASGAGNVAPIRPDASGKP